MPMMLHFEALRSGIKGYTSASDVIHSDSYVEISWLIILVFDRKAESL